MGFGAYRRENALKAMSCEDLSWLSSSIRPKTGRDSDFLASLVRVIGDQPA